MKETKKPRNVTLPFKRLDTPYEFNVFLSISLLLTLQFLPEGIKLYA